MEQTTFPLPQSLNETSLFNRLKFALVLPQMYILYECHNIITIQHIYDSKVPHHVEIVGAKW